MAAEVVAARSPAGCGSMAGATARPRILAELVTAMSNGGVANKYEARLGGVQETLFIPLAARARETGRKRPVLRDPKAVEMVRWIDYDAAYRGNSPLSPFPPRTRRRPRVSSLFLRD